MQSQTLNFSYQAGGDNIAGQLVVTGDASIVTDIAVGSGDTALEVDQVITNAQVKALVLVCDKAVTVKTNHADGTADNTVALTANVPVIWIASQMGANPFVAANVTKLYVNNTSGIACTLKIRAMLDITP